MKIVRTTEATHPILVNCINRIQKNIIDLHSIPIRVFETERDHERHNILIKKGKTRNIVSRHLFNLDNDPPLYNTAVDYVYYDEKWSWNLRNNTIKSWYVLFGNLVLDLCPELDWAGLDRKSVNYCHFQLKENIIFNNLDGCPCVLP